MTIALRPLDRQFGRRTVTRIRRVRARFKCVATKWSVARYFVVEIEKALEGGLLLASLLIATSLLELYVRLRVIEHRHAIEHTKPSPRSARKILKEIEEDRGLTFARMLRELKDAQILTAADVTQLNDLYTSARIPLHHAITGRLIRAHQDSFDLFENADVLDGSSEFEAVIEDQALVWLEKLCAAIELVALKQRRLTRG